MAHPMRFDRYSLVKAASCALCLCFLMTALEAALGERVDFNTHIQPLLSDRCYACHGPDAKARKKNLRLDIAEGAFRPREDGRAVVIAGDPEKSELYRRITASDPEDRMPPAELNRPLSAAEIALFERWIEEGAEWKRHWSFVPVDHDVPVPEVGAPARVENPIDSFVLSRLQQEGLSLAAEASKERLLRRVTLDLTGLPPSIAEIDAYLFNDLPDAYDRLVDSLLASPAYGERMAMDWLDVARFADTYGYQTDRDSSLWPWRDWVIEHFNQNLPYDKFITWQVAGDLLPNATREQILATAFNRNHRQTNEGGSISEEFRVEYNADRVKTTALAFLGLTMECARCHSHKYDPITQRDYYRFFAFFNSTDEFGLYSHHTNATPCPTLLLYEDGEEEKHRALKALIEEQTQALANRRRAAGFPAFERWLEALNGEASVSFGADPVGDFSFDAIQDGKVQDAANGELSGELRETPGSVEGRFGKALQFSGEDGVDFKKLGKFRRTDPFSFSLWIWIPEEKEEIIVLHRSSAGSDAGSRGYQFVLEGGKASFALIHFWPGNSIKVLSRDKLPLGEWLHVAMTYDGSSRAGGIRLFLNGQRLPVDIVRDNLFKDILYDDEKEKDGPPLQLARRSRSRGLKGGRVDALKVFDLQLSSLEVRGLHRPTTLAALGSTRPLTGLEREALCEHYMLNEFPAVDEPYAALLSDLKKTRNAENDLANRVREIMVLGDRPRPRPTHILRRGAYDAPLEAVAPGTPDSILPFDDSLPRNRLGLARWLTDRRNPLTARVTVNRYWQLFFGRGLVETAEDFGSQGKRPSHPALLDWLAKWFMDQDWDLKALHKLIVSSATYRQRSAQHRDSALRNPENVLLSRGPNHRLSAEVIRDNLLAASGLLDRRIGGPSIKALDQAGHKRSDQMVQERSSYRRALYTYIKRSETSPYLLTFDATSREDCIARRQSTNTPLQALVLLNDTLFHQASRALAARMEREGGAQLGDKLVFAFRSVTGRSPRPRELEILTRLYEEQRALFDRDPEGIAALVHGVAPEGYDARRYGALAALTVVASAIMNFDEGVMKR